MGCIGRRFLPCVEEVGLIKMNPKKRILYNASDILIGMIKEECRCGIYFCAYNILKEMSMHDDVEIRLYNSTPRWLYNEKKLREMLGNPNISLSNDSAFLLWISKCYISVYGKTQRYRKKKKRFREYFFRCYGFAVKVMSEMVKICSLMSICLAEFDYFFSPAEQAPECILKNERLKSVIVLHDTIACMYPQYFPKKKWNSKNMLERLMESMDNKELFFANSENTKKDFLRLRNDLNPERIILNYHACGSHFQRCQDTDLIESVKKKYEIANKMKYIFSLCAIEPRKNLVRIVRSFIAFCEKNSIDDLVLALGGAAWTSFIAEFEKQVGHMAEFDKYVKRIGYVDDEDLPVLYSGAEWFVYTSQYEGFGVPPLEAMSCGCPVIASNNSSLPEVVGDAGILIDWDSDEQHIRAYEKYYFDEDYRREQAQKGLERSGMFSWKKTVDKMLEAMERDRDV